MEKIKNDSWYNKILINFPQYTAAPKLPIRNARLPTFYTK